MKWKYSIQLQDETAFSEIEQISKVHFSEYFKNEIKKGNAAVPEKKRILILGKERVFSSMLLFDKTENSEIMTVFSALKIIAKEEIVPFGLDPFGNLFCLDQENSVLFWNHEEDCMEKSNYSFEEFMSKLY